MDALFLYSRHKECNVAKQMNYQGTRSILNRLGWINKRPTDKAAGRRAKII